MNTAGKPQTDRATTARKPNLAGLVNQPYDEESYSPWSGPNILFWKYFVQRGSIGLKINIPDVVIVNQPTKPLFWVYSDKHGIVRTTQSFQAKDVIEKLALEASPSQLVAIVKKKQYADPMKCESQLVNCRSLHSTVVSVLNGPVLAAIQRFVRCKSHPFICRTVFRLAGPSECWVITSKNEKIVGKKLSDFVVETANLLNCNVVHSRKGSFLSQTKRYLRDLVQFVRNNHHLDLSEISADFTRDEQGLWWLLGVKHFKTGKEEGRICFLKERRSKMKLCSYCERLHPLSELTQRMSARMILESDKFLLHLGKDFDWLRKRTQAKHLVVESLYEQMLVCTRCYELYRLSQTLLGLEMEFAKYQGVPTNEKSLCQHRAGQDLRVQLLRFRMLVFLEAINDVSGVDPHNNYYLEYTLLGSRVKFRLELQRNKAFLNRLKVIYVFAPSERAMADYLARVKVVRLSILSEDPNTRVQELVASLDVDIADLCGKVPLREFYKIFNFKSGYCGWGLSASIGLVSTGACDSSGASLRPYEGLYLPPPDYFSCQPLPPQWQNIIKDLPNASKTTDREKDTSFQIKSETTETQPRRRQTLAQKVLPLKLGLGKRWSSNPQLRVGGWSARGSRAPGTGLAL